MRESVADRLKNLGKDGKPADSIPVEVYAARVKYLQDQALELMNQARFLHVRILLALQANELDPQLCKTLYEGFLNMAALVQVKE